MPPPPPPRCATDATRPEAVDEYETKIKNAPYVFTGKVTRILEHGVELPSIQIDADGEALDNANKVFQVRIKRVLKGDFPWNPMDVELTKPHTHKSVEVFVRGNETESNRVLEEESSGRYPPRGIAATRCRHVLRQNHTAIFLARREDAVHRGDVLLLLLTSNPLALTLRNLDKVNAAVKDMSYKPRAPIIEEPCEKQYCSYGANCVTDAQGRARCECPADCPDVDAPVCGTDGVTYANHCLLRKKSCQDETNTRVHHSGECGSAGDDALQRRG